MPLRHRIATAVAALAILLASPSSHAASFRIDLPGLVGAYDTPADHREAAYDLGVDLASIESIGFELEMGDANGSLFCTTSIPPHCSAVTQLSIVLSGSGGSSLAFVAHALRRDSLNGFNFSPGGILAPGLGFLADPWPEFLLGREGVVGFRLAETGWGFYRGEILSAKLVIVGTPVPSPSTAGSILLGVAMLSAIGRVRRQTA